MLVFIRSYLSAYDARMGKHFRVMGRLGIPFRFIGWNRDGRPLRTGAHEILYERASRLGARWHNALAIIGWNLFLARTLFRLRREIAAVHAVDLDTAAAAFLFCRLFGKPLIFDVYDKYTAVRSIDGPAGWLLDALERYIARRADLTLLASEDRFGQMDLPKDLPNVLVLENVPGNQVSATALPKFDGRWRVGYFGVLEPIHRGLEDLMRVASRRSDVELHLAGYGGLEAMVADFAAKHENIHYHGPKGSDAGLELMAEMHAIAGLYYLSVPNHAFAAPNKYYEHLMIGRGLLTSAGTSPGRRVEQHSTGWAIGEGADALDAWLDGLRPEAVETAGRAARALWEERYKDYFEERYVSVYGSRVAELVKASPNG